MSEYGISDDESGASEAFATEEEVYERLGMAFISPELRENRGELEAARKETLPKLIEQGDLRGDLHMHTTLSDGRNSLEEMVAGAASWATSTSRSPTTPPRTGSATTSRRTPCAPASRKSARWRTPASSC